MQPDLLSRPLVWTISWTNVMAAADEITRHWVSLLVTGWLGLICWAQWRRNRGHVAAQRAERLLREELESYARLEFTLAAGDDARPMAKQVCRLVADKSAFGSVAVLLQDAEGRIYVAGSVAMDPETVAALELWGAQAVDWERGVAASREFGRGANDSGPQRASAGQRLGGHLGAHLGTKLGAKSFVLDLGLENAQPEAGELHESWQRNQAGKQLVHQAGKQAGRLGRAIVAPLHSAKGRLAGALAVSHGPETAAWPVLGDTIAPVEALAAKLGRMLENAALTERLVRVEKLAGLGQLAGGVAHELNNPLTAVLGFAELIAETSAEARVREDAQMILTEALRMREIVQNLVDFWRPVAKLEDGVDLGLVLGEMTTACRGMLEQRGIGLVVAASRPIPPIRGNAQRLRLVLEHLLNNAAQAILQSRPGAGGAAKAGTAVRAGAAAAGMESGDLHLHRLERDEEEPPAIRVTVSHGGDAVHLVVSDTGPGFRDPARVFDPFYTTRQPGQGTGLGLSICYGVVREHGGQISAFNLHPHGAAVVVELPIHRLVSEEDEERTAIHLVTEDSAKSK
jgi:signal transduction histidine kinase